MVFAESDFCFIQTSSLYAMVIHGSRVLELHSQVRYTKKKRGIPGTHQYIYLSPRPRALAVNRFFQLITSAHQKNLQKF
jgi:hypothetical protein